MSFLLLQMPALPSAVVQFLPIILIFAIFYFLLFMPMHKQKKQQKQMLESLKSGDEVVTNGGIIGTIVAVHPDDTLVLRIKPDNIKLQFARGAVASMVNAEKKS